MVDIDGGKDLALILVEDVANKSVEQIADFIREKGKKIKSGKGDAEHKKRTSSAKLMPAFVVTVLKEAASFLACKLGLNIPALAIKKNQFGTACVTSLGMLNFEDATAPFSGFVNVTSFLSINAIHEAPVVEDGKIAVGKIMNCNFVVDHRYADGGKAKNYVSSFKRVFDNPQNYISSSGREDKKQA